MDWENTTELQYILAHEYVHVRRFDAVTKILLIVVLCIHWFNPLVWVMYWLANRDLELSCDEAVIRIFGKEARADYARILLRMQAEQNRSVPLWNGFSTNAAEERIGAIMKARRSTMLSITVASVIVAGISVLFATSSNQMLRSTVHSETYSIVTANSAVYSVDHGKTWISEEEYNSLYLKQDITWWTYTEYKDYLEEQIPRWQNLVGKAKYNDHLEKIGIYTQEEIDQTIAIYKENLEAIKHGAKLSRSIESEGHPDTAVALFIHPSEPSIAYSASAIDQSGKIIDLGTFLTKEEQMKALQKLD